MWSDILDKARRGGLNVIQTYVFWNIHEPVEGQVMMNILDFDFDYVIHNLIQLILFVCFFFFCNV